MKKILAAAVVVVSLAPMGALAQERAGDAALGALSGAVVLGPVGAVAGAVVGYAAGPSIARSWGLKRTDTRAQARAKKPAATTDAKRQAAAQGVTRQAASPGSTQAAATPAAAKGVPAAPPKLSAAKTGGWNPPPVQGFD